MQRYLAIWLAVVAFYFLISCSSSDDSVPPVVQPTTTGDGTPPSDSSPTTDNTPTTDDAPTTDGTLSGEINMWGIVRADEDILQNEVDLSAMFFRFDSNVSAALLAQDSQVTSDTCQVIANQDITPEPATPDSNLPSVVGNFTSISAGEAINFSSAGNTFAELTRGNLGGFVGYQSVVDPIVGPMPTDLILDIPGDEFPQYSAIPVPNLGPFTLQTPASGEQITPSTIFAWTPSALPGAIVDIDVQSIDSAAGTILVVSCEAIDDGSFSFPATTQIEMGESFATIPGFGATVDRKLIRFHQQGSTLLMVTSSQDI